MDLSNYLFPKDLRVSETNLSKILVIGSCLSEYYVRFLSQIKTETCFDYILLNNLSDFPENPPAPLEDYKLQYLQIPLRSILTDAYVQMYRFSSIEYADEMVENAKNFIELFLEKAMEYNKKSGILTLISNFIVPQGRAGIGIGNNHTSRDLVHVVEELNSFLYEKVKKYRNTYIADVNSIASSLGKRHFLDDMIFFYTHGSIVFPDWSGHENGPSWTAPEPGRIEEVPPLNDLSELKYLEFFEAVYDQIDAIYRTVNQIDQVKVVIFDLDNTLWRGLIGDHYQPGQEWPYTIGWPMGVWEAIHHLRSRGIMVSISSKNDFSLVESTWESIIDPPFVKLSDFIVPQINWNPKAENIATILNSLSLTAKSAVFVDDNPVERAAVKEAFPEIRTIGSNPFMTRRILLWSSETQIAQLTEESTRREDMVKKQIVRETEKSGTSREEFLKNLQTAVRLFKVDSLAPEFSRAFELLNKTNQFNTNGRRWNHSELTDFITSGGKVYAFSVSDKYADYGLVGVVLIKDSNVVQYVMSCRVLGMDIETSVVAEIIKNMRSESPNTDITANIVETPSNMPCRDLYKKSGFNDIDETGNYRFPSTTGIVDFPNIRFTHS